MIKRFFRRLFSAIWNFLVWILTLAFGLFLYVGVKGFTYLMTVKYESTPSLVPLFLDLCLEGIVAMIFILPFVYFLAPIWKRAAVFFTLLLCSAANGYNVWRCMQGQLSVPLWELHVITGLTFIVGLVTFAGLLRFRKYRMRVAA